MKLKSVISCVLAAATLVGCTTTAEFINDNQPSAALAAQNRGRFELSCSEVSTTLLNSKTIDLYTRQIPEYQFGVSGCDKKEIYTVTCNPDSGCMAYHNKDQVLDEVDDSGVPAISYVNESIN
ncbi:hypothetical protein [Vibrio superstes]|nr:hypothetical protein [Vibrio superstes]